MISRLYYSIYLQIQKKDKFETKGSFSHESLINSITDRRTKILMIGLKDIRIKADYNVDTTVGFDDVTDAFKRARKIGKKYLDIDL